MAKRRVNNEKWKGVTRVKEWERERDKETETERPTNRQTEGN